MNMLFSSAQQLDFLAQFLPLDSQPITLVSSQDYLGIFERHCPARFQIERWLLIEYSSFHSLIKFRGKRQFIQDYLQGREVFYELENRLYEAENSLGVHPDELTDLPHQLEVQENRNESLFQLLLSHNQMPFMLDLLQFFEQLSHLTSATSDQFNFAQHPEFDWDAIALDYIFDRQKIYGTSLPDLFATELTPDLAHFEPRFQQILTSYFFNLDWTYQSVNGWKYAILGRRTVYQLPPLFADSSSSVSVVDPTSPSSFLSLSSSELRQCRSPSAANEKLRRCLMAMIHFNDYSTTDQGQKWAINQTSLQRLSGCHRDAVKRFLVENAQLIHHHNSRHGLTERHNTGKGRAGVKIEQVIFW